MGRYGSRFACPSPSDNPQTSQQIALPTFPVGTVLTPQMCAAYSHCSPPHSSSEFADTGLESLARPHYARQGLNLNDVQNSSPPPYQRLEPFHFKGEKDTLCYSYAWHYRQLTLYAQLPIRSHVYVVSNALGNAICLVGLIVVNPTLKLCVHMSVLSF